MDDLKREYEHKIMSLTRREDGMKAEYRMAIDVQHAAKDKWYQRYYAMFSPERHRSEQVVSPPHRDVNTPTNRPSFARKDPPDSRELREARETRSPLRDRLFKVKSERNLNLSPRNEVPSLSSARSEI
jgi:hypothetical protein